MHALTARCLLLLLTMVLLSPARAQEDSTFLQVPVLQSKLPVTLAGDWRYNPGDDAAWATPNYDASWWVLSPGQFYTSGREGRRNDFPGVAWFRTWITLDSALTGKPLALAVGHKAKAQVFIDGLRIDGGKQELQGSAYKPPLVFTLDRPGRHLIAVRFEDSAMRTEARSKERTGFTLTINAAPDAIESFRTNLIALTSLLTLFMVFFGSFGLLHLILYLYFRAERSNAWFALFCLAAGIFFGLFYVALAWGYKPAHDFAEGRLGILLAIVFLTLSAFINELFGSGRMRFRIAQAGLIGIIASILYRPLGAWFAPVVVTTICIEALVLIVRAGLRKVPGARIIGAGIAMFALMVIGLALFISAGPAVTHSVEDDWVGAVIGFSFIGAVLAVPLSMSIYLAWHYASVRKGLRMQLAEVERLSAEALEHEAEKQRLLEIRAEDLEREVDIRTEELRRQRDKSDELLENILPAEVAEELKEKGSAAARLYDNVSVLFTDFADFTQRSEALSPDELVAELNACFSAFDGIITRHGLEKIKTVGDAYIAVSGLPAANEKHAQAVVVAALEVRDYMAARKAAKPATFGIRLGVHSGPVVAGIVGVKKFAYDIWGDTVNTAARMEQHSVDGRLNISAATYELVKDDFSCTYRGEVEAKHKGKMGMYFVEGLP